MDSLTRFLQTASQLAIIGAVWGVSDLIIRFTHLPISSGILGLFLMLALLGLDTIRPGMVDRGARQALGELVLFFIPIMVSVLQYQDLLMSEGWQLTLTIVVGTALVMISTALTLDFCYRWKRRLYKKLHSQKQKIKMDYTALACFIWTCFACVVAKKIHRKKPLMISSPVATVSVSIILLSLAFDVNYNTYHKYAQGIAFLLAPVTVAFAVPIYENREVIHRQLPILSIVITMGMFVGVVSTFLMSRMFHFNNKVTNSLMARSISTPFAVTLAGEIHGSASFVSLLTIITDFVGMIFGDLFLAPARIRFHTANGVAFGNTAHGLGALCAGQRHETEGVMASLTMVLAGLFMILLSPIMVYLVI